jgi:hypothetical protein
VRLPESDVKNLLSRLRNWWWWLWTGDQSEAATRRRIEHEAARFGGTVTWDTPAERRDKVITARRNRTSATSHSLLHSK